MPFHLTHEKKNILNIKFSREQKRKRKEKCQAFQNTEPIENSDLKSDQNVRNFRC